VGVADETTAAGVSEGIITTGVFAGPTGEETFVGWVTPPGAVGAHADNKATIKTIMKSGFVCMGPFF